MLLEINAHEDVRVESVIDSILYKTQKNDCNALMQLMQRITGSKPTIWGERIIGFGEYHYELDNGAPGRCFLTAIAPSRKGLTLYGVPAVPGYKRLLEMLGAYRLGRACLYVKSLDTIDLSILEKLVKESISYMNSSYETSMNLH